MDKKTRIQQDLSVDSLARLKRLKEITDVSSYADVTKNAYKCYEIMIDLKLKGYKFYLEKDDERVLFELLS